jgi:hypothetical protein
MPVNMKPIATLSRRELSDLRSVKSKLSARYLHADAPAAALRARALRTAHDLSPQRNVVGVGIDEKYVAGIPTGVPVVKFLVRSKVAPSALSRGERLPSTVDGFPTDVEETGPIVPQAKRSCR